MIERCKVCGKDKPNPHTLISLMCHCPDRGEVEKRIIHLLRKQTEKGVSKYGHTLDDCPDDKFDWRLMAMEELIDLVQYQQKEIMRLEKMLNP